VVEPFRHHRGDRRESALDFVGHSQGEHEVLAGGSHIFRRSQDGAEIVARMSETARRHITVEEIDIARQAGVEERRLIQRGLAASDQRAAAWGAVPPSLKSGVARSVCASAISGNSGSAKSL
jgi:hypothetical protein